MVHVVNIILYLLVNIAGVLMVYLVPGIAQHLQIYPEFISPYQRDHMNQVYRMVAYGALVAGTGISVGYFMVKKGRQTRELRTWCLLAPIYMTFIGAMGVIIYFRFIR